MMQPRRKMLAALALTSAAAAGVAIAADTPKAPADEEHAIYRPVTSDLMNAFIQPRHSKLWLAGQAGNWEYAEYERHNIGGALARMEAAIPAYEGASNKDLIAAFATPPLAQLQTAIAAKDKQAFATAYQALTAGCNGCHEATSHGMIVVQTPNADTFPDQVFTPVNR